MRTYSAFEARTQIDRFKTHWVLMTSRNWPWYRLQHWPWWFKCRYIILRNWWHCWNDYHRRTPAFEAPDYCHNCGKLFTEDYPLGGKMFAPPPEAAVR